MSNPLFKTCLQGITFFRGDNLEFDGLRELAKVLATNQTWTYLGLHNSLFNEDNMRELSHALSVNQTLTHLDVSYTYLGPEGIHMLGLNHTLTKLNLHRACIRDQEAHDLADALCLNHTLTDLDLGDNQISNRGAQDLAHMLSVNRTLTHLDLNNNPIGVCGELFIVEGLQSNETLTHLGIYGKHVIPWINQNRQRINQQRDKAFREVLQEPNNKLRNIIDHYVIEDILTMSQIPMMKIYSSRGDCVPMAST